MVEKFNLKNDSDLQRLMDNQNDYIFLKTDSAPYRNDIKKLSHNIQVMEVIQHVHLANKLCSDLGSENKISTDILLKTIEAGFTGIPFTDELLTEYFNFTLHVNSFMNAIQYFQEISLYVPFDLEFNLFGITLEKYSEIAEGKKVDFEEDYGTIFQKLMNKEIGVSEFIKQAKILVKEVQKVD